MNKKVFHRLGNHFINQYEIRRVELQKSKQCGSGCMAIPKITVIFKDGSKISVASIHVPRFLQALENT